MPKRELQVSEPPNVRDGYESEPGVKASIPRDVAQRGQRHEPQTERRRNFANVRDERRPDASAAEIGTNIELCNVQRRSVTLGEHESHRSMRPVFGDPKQRISDCSVQAKGRYGFHEVWPQDAWSKRPGRFELDAPKLIDVARPCVANADHL
jgi:hypothetical protein